MSYVATNLGLLPGGNLSIALACSYDGNLAVGWGNDSGGIPRPCYWDNADVLHILPDLGFTGTGFNNAIDVTADATKIVGFLATVDGQTAAVWSGVSFATITQLANPDPTVSATSATVVGCSFNAAVIGGWFPGGGSLPGGGNVPCVWDFGPAYIGSQLPLPPGYFSGQPYGVSPNGSALVGFAATGLDFDGGVVPVIWQRATPTGWFVTVLLTDATGPSVTNNVIMATSFDNSIRIGTRADASDNAFAAFWLPTSLPVDFAGPVGGSGSFGIDCDWTGDYVCGTSASELAAIWVNGVGQLLPDFAGAIDVLEGTAFSPDATTIVGAGTDAGGHQTAVRWVLSGPPPFTPAKLNMGEVVVTSLATESPCTVAQFTTPPPVPNAVGLRWSNTRGLTFGNAVPQGLSTDPLSQLQWNRTGYARDRVFELFWSAAVKTALNGAFVIVEPWKS